MKLFLLLPLLLVLFVIQKWPNHTKKRLEEIRLRKMMRIFGVRFSLCHFSIYTWQLAQRQQQQRAENEERCTECVYEKCSKWNIKNELVERVDKIPFVAPRMCNIRMHCSAPPMTDPLPRGSNLKYATRKKFMETVKRPSAVRAWISTTTEKRNENQNRVKWLVCVCVLALLEIAVKPSPRSIFINRLNYEIQCESR